MKLERLLLLSDLMICETEAKLLVDGKLEQLFSPELCELLFSSNQVVVANLEGPITRTGKKQGKGDSPSIKSDPEIMRFLERFPNLIISGANNHITDFSDDGLRDTQRILKSHNIPAIGFAGVGDNLCAEYEITLDGQRIYIYAVAQNEFSSLRYNSFGANGYDPLTTFDHIYDLKSKVDHLIVIFHGGKENYQYPTPEQQRICRKMISCGADLVVCQHSHCIGCQETYLDGNIIYGTGNFFFNLSADSLWDDSLIPIVSVKNNGKLFVDYTVIQRNNHYISIAKGNVREKILNDFDERSSKISDQSFVTDNWVSYCKQNQYYLLMKGFSRMPMRFFYRIDSLLGHVFFRKMFKNSERNLTDLNILRCEVINEMAQTIFSELGRGKEQND